MSARFILSLDCEGKWGVADLLRKIDSRTLSEDSLRTAYGGIVALLDRLDIASTFAFVGLFGETPERFAGLRDAIDSLAVNAHHIFGPRSTTSIRAAAGDGTARGRLIW